MKIAYLIQQFPPEIGAGPARAGEFAERWVSWGAEVKILTSFPNRPGGRIFPSYRGRVNMKENWRGAEVHRSWLYARPNTGLLGTLANNLSFMVGSALNGMARVDRPDVLIASSPPFFVHPAGLALSRYWRVPLVLELRDLWPDYLVSLGLIQNSLVTRALFGLERFLLSRARECVVVTDPFKARVVEKGVPESRITVVPNAVDPEIYRPAPAEPPVEALRPEPGVFRVGYLGNFGAGQGLQSVLDAAHLFEDDTTVRFVLVGDGTEGDKVRGQVESMKSGAPVHVHPPIPKKRTRDFYNSCDLCLVPLAPAPALQETIPSKLFEILACATPVLVCAHGEAARIVRESEGGLAVDPGDPEAIADGIRQIRTLSRDERRAMGERGRTFVRAFYDRDVQARRYFDMLSRIVADDGSAQPRGPTAISASS